MYPASKTMDAVHRTGVFYQAMPAVGADGKNIMKLIPVRVVNGQFLQIQTSNPTTDPKPKRIVHINIASAPVQVGIKAALNPSATQQIVMKQVSLVNSLPNQVGVDLRNSFSKRPLLQQAVNVMAKAPTMAAPATNPESVRFPKQLPVTVKSPVLPRGQYLQIPPNAQVRTVPASELPPGIKKKIFTSSASSSPASGSPSVVYVSPITTVNQRITSPSDSALHSLKLLSKTSNTTSCGLPSNGSKPHLKMIPEVSQRPNSPIKWTIEEEDGTVAPSLDPLNSPTVTSKILRAVAERENAGKRCDVITKPVSQLSEGKSKQENALVMCNGRVFFVVKKCSPPTKSSEFNKATVPSSQQALESGAPEIKQDLKIIIPDESDEVIDLCDDDAQEDLSQQAASVNVSAVTHLDEDNVIFVSYIPPKSESGSAQDLILEIQKVLEKKTDQMGTSSSSSVTEQKSLDGTTGSDGRDEIAALRGKNPGRSMLSTTAASGSNSNNSQHCTSIQQSERTEVTVSETDPSNADSSSAIYSGMEKDTHKMESSMNPETRWTSSPHDGTTAPQSCERADHMLRQIFHITADVKICLQRIDEGPAGSVPAEPPQRQSIRSVEDHREAKSVLKDKKLSTQGCYHPQATDSDNGVSPAKRVKVLTEQELSAGPATLSPHTHIGPLKCSHFKMNTRSVSALKCNSGQSPLKGTSCELETEPVIGYVEPIGEDILSTDENDIPNSQDTDVRPQSLTLMDLNTNTRRMGRTRKRTICPCCIPGTQASAVKSRAKSVEPEKWAWMTEQTSKKDVRAKAARKDAKTSGRISCSTAKSKQNCRTYEVPASDSLPTTSMDFDEQKHYEEIKRLRMLLREKEAALELMRKSVS
ncbi:ligand-dependent nuclear receptor-interacting factor 1 isoform X2 [Chelmon rostratus]|uniref:ligand-dependent nuclear receptor-interacting factor 1 isoform X2 n=1 Tax=Chelmon rostratus TaxID=109905 RepID=UPI001BE898D9|nr:ligand-dependent nuclear receptor-interacting factor 1 isoform X2 [Chelmon rostratus]